MNERKLNRLLKLEEEVNALRKELGVSPCGETLFQAARSMWSDSDVVVEADGRGGAVLMVVSGNYPADYISLREQVFPTQEAACEAAERMVDAAVPNYRTTPE